MRHSVVIDTLKTAEAHDPLAAGNPALTPFHDPGVAFMAKYSKPGILVGLVAIPKGIDCVAVRKQSLHGFPISDIIGLVADRRAIH